MSSTNQCAYCQTEFQPTRKGHIYCSSKCAKDANRPLYSLKCEHCGIDFETTYAKQKFCSRQCSSDAILFAPRLKTCLNCGKQFERVNHKQVYCSVACRQSSDPGKRTTFVCLWCGKEFENWTYRHSRYCSLQCASEYGARQPKPSARRPENFVNLTCEQCGASYRLHKNVYAQRGSRFCSAKCKGASKSEHMRGENNPNYKDGTSHLYPGRGKNWWQQRNAAMERDGHRCQKCNENATLEVHHIEAYRLFKGNWEKANHLSNLITLCRQCHISVENGETPCPTPRNLQH